MKSKRHYVLQMAIAAISSTAAYLFHEVDPMLPWAIGWAGCALYWTIEDRLNGITGNS